MTTDPRTDPRDPVGGVPALARELLALFTAAWWEADTGLPDLGPRIARPEQSRRERELEALVDRLLRELKAPPGSACEREAAERRVAAFGRDFAKSTLDLEDRHLDALLQAGFPEAAREFARKARRFDPTVSGEDIAQAGRNVWTMSSAQMMLGLPVRLSPSVFAYSLLYPATDNLLDDPSIPEESKRAFNDRFERRLRGEAISPSDPHEQTIWRLVSMIEDEYDRSSNPQVFESLLAIHRAQERSLLLLRPGASPYEVDVLGITLEKGGTSVLADGYLVAGSLRRPQAELFFGLGALLQLADDLQDVCEDTRSGVLTVFSQTARRWPLDRLTDRTLEFRARVLERLSAIDAPEAEPLLDLVKRSSLHLILSAAGQASPLYSKSYIRELEAHSPFRFPFLLRQRKRLAREHVSILAIAQASWDG